MLSGLHIHITMFADGLDEKYFFLKQIGFNLKKTETIKPRRHFYTTDFNFGNCFNTTS